MKILHPWNASSCFRCMLLILLLSDFARTRPPAEYGGETLVHCPFIISINHTDIVPGHGNLPFPSRSHGVCNSQPFNLPHLFLSARCRASPIYSGPHCEVNKIISLFIYCRLLVSKMYCFAFLQGQVSLGCIDQCNTMTLHV